MDEQILYSIKGVEMKKKICILALLLCCLLPLTACGKKTNLNFADRVIEKRENLFLACDDLYLASLSTGTREENYNLDGVVTAPVPFGILTLTRLDNRPLSNDTYSYIVTINGENHSGFLSKSNTDNSYSADLEVNTVGNEEVSVKISFTGYTFDQNLTNISKDFQVDSASALKVAENELGADVSNVLKDKNVSIEVVMKVLKDHSNADLKNYYWYVGVVASTGETFGILIDANSGNIIAKKV